MSKIVGISGKAGSGKDTVADFLVEHQGFVKVSLADEMKRFCKLAFGFTDEQLWGPSQNRNEVDRRFNDPDVWDQVEDNLFEHGRAWCARLLVGASDESVTNAYWSLLTWWDNLRGEYGVDFGKTNTLSPRVALQTIGTEFGRSVDRDVWLNFTLDLARKLLADPAKLTYRKAEGLVPSVFLGTLGDIVQGVVVADCRFLNEVEGIKAAGGRVIRVRREGQEVKQVGVAGHASEAEMDTIPDTTFDHVLKSPEGLGKLYLTLAAFIPNIVRSLS